MLSFLALYTSGLFAGAALYVSLVEHPARLTTGAAAALAEWRPSYRRGAVMQASLAGLGLILGIGAYSVGAGPLYLAGGLLLGIAIPFTLIKIMPISKQLQDKTANLSDDEILRLLGAWGRLHQVRTFLGLAALILIALAHPSR